MKYFDKTVTADALDAFKEGSVCLGSGNFATAYRCDYKGSSYVLKEYQTWKEAGVPEDRVIKDFNHEEGMLQKMPKHPNLIELLFTFKAAPRPSFIFQYQPGSIDLFGKISDGKEYKIETKSNWMRQVASGLDALHQAEIAHCDIKLDNITVDDKDKITIIDMGTSQQFSEVPASIKEGAVLQKSLEGRTVMYLAPECVDASIEAEVLPDKQDVFALGVVFHALLAKTFCIVPTEVVSAHCRSLKILDETMEKKLKKVKFPEFHELIRRMLLRNPVSRLNAKGVMDLLSVPLAAAVGTSQLNVVTQAGAAPEPESRVARIESEARVASDLVQMHI